MRLHKVETQWCISRQFFHIAQVCGYNLSSAVCASVIFYVVKQPDKDHLLTHMVIIHCKCIVTVNFIVGYSMS